MKHACGNDHVTVTKALYLDETETCKRTYVSKVKGER